MVCNCSSSGNSFRNSFNLDVQDMSFTLDSYVPHILRLNCFTNCLSRLLFILRICNRSSSFNIFLQNLPIFRYKNMGCAFDT